MFDSLGDIWNQNQERLQAEGVRPGQMNTAGLAGQLIASGVMPKDAYVQAAKMFRDQEVVNLERQKQEQQQQMALQAAKLFQQGEANGTPQNTLAQLLSMGMRPQDAAALVQTMTPNPLQNTFSGIGGVRYQGVTNPTTGELEARALPGQMMKEEPKLSMGEMRINANRLKELSNDARTAEKELRLLEDSYEAFEELDKAEGRNTITGSGSIISKVAPSWGENIVLTKKGQAAKQKIDKINSQLFQNRILGAGARATDAFKEEVKKGLPTYQLQPDARTDILKTKARENLEQLARSRFYSEWAKVNKKDLNGAEDAFTAYITNAPLLDESGRINREILKDIPRVVAEFSMEGGDGSFETNEMVEEVVPTITRKETPREILERRLRAGR